MTLQLIGLTNLIQPFKRHLLMISLILSALWLGWSGWQLWKAWPDRPLPADRITARELKVNETQLQQLKTNLDSYQAPADPLPLTGS